MQAKAQKQLADLAAHFHESRDHILRRWQESVGHDEQLPTATKISHAQFNDHIPRLLDAFEHRLRARDAAEARQARLEQRENAAEHGLMRWHLGYNQRETMREWGHLQFCLLQELEQYEADHRRLARSVLPTARAVLTRLCAEGVCESAGRYAQLQETEAAARARELNRTLQELMLIERERATLWREAAHDLRGTVGVISNASAIVTSSAIQEPARSQFSSVLTRSVAAARDLLNDLIDLSRLEAGQEQRHIVEFDAAQLLRDLCDSLRVLTTDRNLFLKFQGPVTLAVQGDPVKVRRVVQNLVLNALKATEHGGIQVTCQERDQPGARQWMVSVQDTGPGIDMARAAPLERVLKHATTESHEVDVRASLAGEDIGEAHVATLLASEGSATMSPSGEGIGLAIVKRLCELLDAVLELESAADSGTTFRIILPRDYEK